MSNCIGGIVSRYPEVKFVTLKSLDSFVCKTRGEDSLIKSKVSEIYMGLICLWATFLRYEFSNPIVTIIYIAYIKYSARRLIGTRIIESAAYCNQKLLAHLYLNSTQNTSAYWIIRLLLSLLCWPEVILLSGGHCSINTNQMCKFKWRWFKKYCFVNCKSFSNIKLQIAMPSGHLWYVVCRRIYKYERTVWIAANSCLPKKRQSYKRNLIWKWT